MNEEIKDKSYYAIIPAAVRYDKDLPANAKLMYGEINALSNQKGYCWASNAYFAELYNVHKNTISIWINKLIKRGYISAEYVYLEGTKHIEERHLKASIYINENRDINESSERYQQNHLGDNNENAEDIIISNKKNNCANSPAEELFLKLWQLYPCKKGKSAVSKNSKKDICMVGMVKMAKAIEKYNQELMQNPWKQPMNGSTFFNGRYEDYLQEEMKKEDVIKKGKVVLLSDEELTAMCNGFNSIMK